MLYNSKVLVWTLYVCVFNLASCFTPSRGKTNKNKAKQNKTNKMLCFFIITFHNTAQETPCRSGIMFSL